MTRSNGWVVIPLLAALVACKTSSGSNAAPDPMGADPKKESAERAAGVTVPAAASGSRNTGSVPLTVIEGRAEVEETGFLHIVGEIRNDSARYAAFPRVDIQLFDAAGKLIGVDSIAAAEGHGESSYGARENVPPGEVSPYHYIRDVKKLARPYASHKLFAHAVPSDDRVRATVENVQLAKENVGKTEYWRLTGTVKNVGAACRYPTAVIAYYDAAGKAYEVRDGLTEWESKNEFPVGGSASFRTGPLDTRGIVKSYKVWGECKLP